MPHSERELVSDLLQALTSTVNLRVLVRRERLRFEDAQNRARELDATVHVALPDGQEVELAIEAARQAFPRDIRLAIERLRAYETRPAAASSPMRELPFVAAEHLSEGSRSELRRAGINFFDGTGTLFFRHGTWLVDIERRRTEPENRRIGSVFTGAREQVVHALLVHWLHSGGDAFISGTELARMAQTSPYTVSKTMQELERRDWVEAAGAGPTQRRRVREPAALLDAWAAAWTGRAETRTPWFVFAPEGIVQHVVDGLADRSAWALTGAAAANETVHHLSRVDRAVFIVPPGRGEAWGQELKLQRVDKGANVVLVEREGAALLFAEKRLGGSDARIASPFVQYLDLLDGVGRNKELANEFRRRCLGIEAADGE